MDESPAELLVRVVPPPLALVVDWVDEPPALVVVVDEADVDDDELDLNFVRWKLSRHWLISATRRVKRSFISYVNDGLTVAFSPPSVNRVSDG